MCHYNASDLSTLAQLYGIHPLTCEDIATYETREKCDVFSNYHFCSMLTFNQDTANDVFMDPVPVFIITTSSGVLSFHPTTVVHTHNVLVRLPTFTVEFSHEWIAYAIVDDILDHLRALVTRIETTVSAVDELTMVVKNQDREEMLRRVFGARKVVTTSTKLLKNKPDLLKSLIKRCDKSVVLHLGDVLDHAVTALLQLSNCDTTLTEAHANYLAYMDVEMAIASNQLERSLSKWTVIGSILIPWTLVSGYFGMNVKVPGNDVDTLDWWWIIMGSMAAYTLLTLATAKYNRLF